MTEQPNILMIVTDQEYAHQPMPEDFVLPSRDRIRARGVSFNHHHCTTTVCTPSRSSMGGLCREKSTQSINEKTRKSSRVSSRRSTSQ